MLTLDEVLAELRGARSTFDDWRVKGLAPKHVKLPNGQLRVRRRVLDTWLVERTRQASRAGPVARRADLGIRVRRDRPKPYMVRWKAGTGPAQAKSFAHRAQADSFRSQLMQASRDRQQPDHGERARHGEVGQSKQHSGSV